MEYMKLFWPTPFKIKAQDFSSFIVQLVIFLVICAVVGILISVLSKIPLIGFIFSILGTIVEVYSLIGIVLCVLKFADLLK